MIFVDTGPLLARYLSTDQHHSEAKRCWRDLKAEGVSLLTTKMVVAEFLTLLARRSSPSFAAERGRTLYESAIWTIVSPGQDEEILAITLLERYGPSGAGFVDCVSFATMQTKGIENAYTFDSHFRLAGFQVTPSY